MRDLRTVDLAKRLQTISKIASPSKKRRFCFTDLAVFTSPRPGFVERTAILRQTGTDKRRFLEPVADDGGQRASAQLGT